MISLFKKSLVAASLGCCLISTPAMALFEDDGARKAILAMREQIADMQSRLARLEQASQGNLTLAEMLSEKDREIAELRGKLEVANNALLKLQDDYRDLYTNFDSRLAKLEPRQIDLGNGALVLVAPEQGAVYDRALRHFKEANFEVAAKQLSQFLIDFPGSKLAPQVSYLLGSSQFALADYKAALATQRNLADTYPDSPRAADALLSVASSQLELRAINNAKKTLSELVSKYPGSSAAATARERLAILN